MKKILLFLIFVLSITLVCAAKDFDNDGMPDSWEKKYNLRYDVNDADEDPDNDGLTNLQEYEQGTNPLVSNKEKSFFFKAIFGFFKDNFAYIIGVIIGLFILYLVYKVASEYLILQGEKKNTSYIKKKKKDYVFDEKPNFQQRINLQKGIQETFMGGKKRRYLKRKKRERFHLTERFGEKIAEDIDFLPYSMSRKIKGVFGLKRKKEDKGNVFDKLPRKK